MGRAGSQETEASLPFQRRDPDGKTPLFALGLIPAPVLAPPSFFKLQPPPPAFRPIPNLVPAYHQVQPHAHYRSAFLLVSLPCTPHSNRFPDFTPTGREGGWHTRLHPSIWSTPHLHRYPVVHHLHTVGLDGQNRSGHSRWQGLDVPGPGHFQSHRSRHNQPPRQPAGSTDWVTPKAGMVDMGGVVRREVGVVRVKIGICVGSWVGS